MRRLLGYMRPYRVRIAISLVFLLAQSALQVLGPLLTRTAVDRYIAPDPAQLPGFLARFLPADASQRTGAHRTALPGGAGRQLRLRVRADVPDAVHRPARHVRSAPPAHAAPAGSRPGVLRSQSGGPPGDPRDHRRGRAERSVRLRTGDHSGRRAGAGLHPRHHVQLQPAADGDHADRHAVRDSDHGDLPAQRDGELPPHPRGHRQDQLLPAGAHHRDRGAATLQSGAPRQPGVRRGEPPAHARVQGRHHGVRLVLPGGGVHFDAGAGRHSDLRRLPRAGRARCRWAWWRRSCNTACASSGRFRT